MLELLKLYGLNSNFMNLRTLSIFWLIIFLTAGHAYSSEETIGKVIDSYIKGDVTHCTLETNRTLVSGRNISLSNGVTVVVGEKLGEKDSVYYYEASVMGKPKIPRGTDVFNKEIEEFIKEKEVFLKLERKSTFIPKQYGEVTAIQDNRVLIDKGSLHEVRERDLYAVYDSSGRYKGKIEMRGLGDFQSSGKMYHSLGDINRGAPVQPGDKVKYLGQRKLFALGFVGNYVKPLREGTNAYGGGLTWNLTFPDGWGAEVLFGGSFEQLKSDSKSAFKYPLGFYAPVITNDGVFSGTNQTGDAYTLVTIAPIMVKKHFFYPRNISPFLGVGGAYFRSEYQAVRIIINSVEQNSFNQTVIRGSVFSGSMTKESFFPIFSGGITLFSGKFLQFRMEAQYHMTPDMDLGFATLETKRFIYTFGFSTGW